MDEMHEKRKKISQQQKNKQNRKPHSHSVKQPHFAKDVRINLRRAKFRYKPRTTEPKSGSESGSGSENESKIQPQPNRDLLSLDDLSDSEDSEQEFVRAPISEKADFIGIPLNECIGIKDDYFMTRELVYMQDEAETAKETENLKESVQLENDLGAKIGTDVERKEEIKTERSDVKSSEFQSLEEDLDFLLTLKEPLQEPITISQIASTSKLEEQKSKFSSKPIKSIDLEKWLDSVLDT